MIYIIRRKKRKGKGRKGKGRTGRKGVVGLTGKGTMRVRQGTMYNGLWSLSPESPPRGTDKRILVAVSDIEHCPLPRQSPPLLCPRVSHLSRPVSPTPPTKKWEDFTRIKRGVGT